MESNEDERLRLLSKGLNKRVTCYKGYNVNGFRFTVHREDNFKQSQNSGVMIKGTTYDDNDTDNENDNENDYFGVLVDIIEMDFLGDGNRFVMFKCDWYDIYKGMKVDPQFHTIQINKRLRLKTYEPFVFAFQAEQVFYVPNVSGKNMDWCTVVITKARNHFDVKEKQTNIYQDVCTEFISLNGNEDDINVDNVSLNVNGVFVDVDLDEAEVQVESNSEDEIEESDSDCSTDNDE